MKLPSRYSYGDANPFQPDFTICKSEGGTANCPSEYVKEFGDLSQTWAAHKLCLVLLGVAAVYCWSRHK